MRMNKLFFSSCFLLLAINAMSQSTLTLKGKVIEEQSNNPMVGVTVYSKSDPSKGTSTDVDGNFSFSLSKGKHIIICSYLGYFTLETEIELVNNSQEVLLKMKENAQQLQEVVVSSNSSMNKVRETQIGVERIEMQEMAKLPVLFGERDIIKSIQLLPGVKSDGDASSGFQVRGGTASQNNILLDDATIYNAGHLMGIFLLSMMML